MDSESLGVLRIIHFRISHDVSIISFRIIMFSSRHRMLMERIIRQNNDCWRLGVVDSLVLGLENQFRNSGIFLRFRGISFFP